ncbi:MAG TPA: lipopolysaccharide biosynthesis protein [Roseiflexaceae bacterium]|nr:lipopolysaccharide biosynthesis protein [Roseiflexaceae bacterium]
MVRLVTLRLLESYFRHRWLNLLPLVLMVALAAAYLTITPPKYRAAGALYVQRETLLTTLTTENQPFSWVTPAQTTANELRELTQTDAFVRAALQQTPLEGRLAEGPQAVEETIRNFREAVLFTPLGDNLVQFSATDPSPETAQKLAQATIDTFLQWKLNADNRDSIVAQEFFTQQLEPYERELQEARDEMDSYLRANPDPLRGERPTEEQIQIRLLQSNIDQAADRLSSAMEKHESARLAQAKAESDVRQNYTVVDAPGLPSRPATSLTDRAKTAAPFLAVGLILALAGIVGGAVLDRSVRFAIDVRHGFDLPVLASLPDSAPHGALLRSQPTPLAPDNDAPPAPVLHPVGAGD